MHTSNFHLVRGAHVDVTKVIDHSNKKHPIAEIVVNDQFKHRFSPNSRVSKHLELMEANDLAERMSGGTFFFVDDTLVDFRDGHYNGFVHEDDSVKAFMDVLGYDYQSNLPFRHTRKKDDAQASGIVLRKRWSNGEISVPGYAQGADFNSQLSFVWNPFVKTINSTFDLVRLICENGMVGLTSFLNNRVPVLNRWEEHLDIASRQIQNKVNSIVVDRVKAMSHERASVADCLLLEQHAADRVHDGGAKAVGERDRLLRVMAAVAPKQHLSQYYQDNVFHDKNLASQVPGHLSNFDVFNIATELRTHTTQSGKSSDNALDKFANGVLFDRVANFTANAARFTAPKVASFADPERAFYGKMH